MSSEMPSGFQIIPFASKYAVNKSGVVLDIRNNTFVRTPVDTTSGTYRVALFTENGFLNKSLARILAEVFIPCSIYTSRLIVGFKDGNKLNITLDNLVWRTPKEDQIFAYKKRTRLFLEKLGHPLVTGEYGLFPSPIETTQVPGFYFIPWAESPWVVNKAGEIKNITNGQFHNLCLSKKGYSIISLSINGKPTTTQVHRIVAMLFVPIPERHSELSHCDLQVNHMDGNKLNNHYTNLEWVTNEENMAHARRIGLFSNEKAVLVKELATGEVRRYPSISSVSRAFNVSNVSIARQSNSLLAGRVPYQGYVMKYENIEPWPEHIFYDSVDCDWGTLCKYILHTNERQILLNSLKAVSKITGVSKGVIERRIKLGSKGLVLLSDGVWLETSTHFIEKRLVLEGF